MTEADLCLVAELVDPSLDRFTTIRQRMRWMGGLYANYWRNSHCPCAAFTDLLKTCSARLDRRGCV